MKTYDEMIAYPNLYRAYLACLKGKRHKHEAIAFSLSLSSNLWSIHYDLKYQRYQVGGYREFKIFDPKERMIQAISFRDRVVQHCVVDNYLIPLLKDRFIYDNVACQRHKGTSLAHQRLRRFLTLHFKKYETKGYVLKLDIHKYFESIDHDVLKELLNNKVEDAKIRSLLFGIISSFNSGNNKGLPMGNQTSQYFALLYLDSVDHFIKEKLRVKYYLRYMDDMVLIVANKKTATDLFEKIKEVVESKKIRLNPKSGYHPLKNGFEMIGWRFKLSNHGKIFCSLRKNTKKRMKTHVKKELSKSHHGLKVQNLKTAYHGFVQLGQAHRFYQSLWSSNEDTKKN